MDEESHPAGEAEEAEGDLPGMSRPGVVVVDDDPDARDLFHFRLERAGMQVWTFADGISGADAIRELRPDIAVIEWNLPLLSGLELMREIRSVPEIRDTAVLLVTRRTQAPYREWAYQAGCDRFLTKPVRAADLRRVAGELVITRCVPLEERRRKYNTLVG